MIPQMKIYFVLSLIVLAVIGGLFTVMWAKCAKNEEGKTSCNIFDWFKIEDKLTAATLCAYIRCTEGCNSPKINDIKNDDFDCKQLCQESMSTSTTGNKICDFGKPIIVELDSPLELTKKDLEKIGIRCLTEPKYDYWYDPTFRVEISTYYAEQGNVFPIFVDKNSISSEGDLETNSKCYESLTINEGKIYVYFGDKPYSGSVSGVCNPYTVGYISHSPIKTVDDNKVVVEIGNYYSISDNVGISMPGDYNDFYDNIIDRCSDGNYGIKLTVNCNGLKSEVNFCQGETKDICNGLKLTPDPSIGFPPATTDGKNLYCHPWVFKIS
ncbi:MAG: hypothetical protein J4428_04465 [Candidatus Aenigmarchaeota archaeon]|nr:hypothetical protein [Candidatus Aenigmarchaeota archaeon]